MSCADSDEPLHRAEDALQRGDWPTARTTFKEALEARESAEAYEGLSWAALAMDAGDEALWARQNAYRLYRKQNDPVSAARMAMWAGKDHEDYRGELAVARGWRQRAHRLLKDQPTVPEHGWLALFDCWASLSHDEDPAHVQQCARTAVAVSEACDEPDLGILALAMEGLALVSDGRVEEGMGRLDEAAAAVLGGELRQPIWELPILCWLIFACERVRDFGHAAEWCEMMRTAAERLEHTASQGICRAHYATILACRGRWQEAEATLSEAAACFKASWPPQTAETTIRLGDLRRRQGRLGEAEALMRPLEWHPLAMLGLAEIALECGRLQEAEERVETYLRHIPESNRLGRAGALELQVRTSAASGDHTRTTQATEELQAIASAVGTGPLQGAACFAAGVLARATGDMQHARACLEDAVAAYERSGTPFEAAHARLELAAVLSALERPERARAETASARRTLEHLGVQVRLHQGSTSEPPPLTPRQVEILRLVAKGLSDAEIASALGISTHTVHRHVANILLRLDAPTRAAAATQAAIAGLI
ncbi:LuxR C-terminal-related transcriptional regulator [Halomonas sp. M5N1S17]|uniref:LuxR C-terminal-related transcriptional regulator n=1 Tax=Halomonas alkalisoli TaxID=2907158 RepID=UPI001F44ECD5|nr:LuxR C-terminal-related transcriptional regulator [Halomonas alkalisoli]MCE9661940.1 LuxR C-terminal-related transcriptional regulator [Halomonas alkalisoli]